MDTKKQDEQPDPTMAGFAGSANEPVAADKQAAPADAGGDDEHGELPANAELEKMTRMELDELAGIREVDVSDAKNKQDVIDALRKDARKRKRAAKED